MGIHHLTALASEAQRNVDFYCGIVGLRLVKRTVNFDAPDVYHLYYGDQTGSPGTILTFFPFPDAARGRRGAGEISAVAFAVPSGSLGWWADRLAAARVAYDGPTTRMGELLLGFEDPDGMAIELVEDADASSLPGWSGGGVDPAHAVRRLSGLTMLHRGLAPTGQFLSSAMGFSAAGSEGSRHRFFVGEGSARARIDVVEDPSAPRARQSAGSVHHIAWRVPGDEEQAQWSRRLHDAGTAPTQVMDRQYFRSIYFREPGGVLFEIATDPPGFLVDEQPDALGTELKLPPWLEPRRALIERHLPPLTVGAELRGGTA